MVASILAPCFPKAMGMNQQDAEEFTQSLGQIGGGWWRQVALARRLGVPKALGLETEQWVKDRLGGYVKMAGEERLKAIDELKKDGHSNVAIAEVIGVDEKTVRNLTSENSEPTKKKRKKNKGTEGGTSENSEPAPLDAVAALAATNKVHAAEKSTKTRQQNEEKRKTDLERPVKTALAPGLHHGDFRTLCDQIDDGSVQLVFTDPPYDEKSVGLYAHAARIAKRILKPGGSFIAYSGQRHLPAVLKECSVYLDYWWTIAGVHGGGNQILNKLGIRCGWKPLVWFVKGTRGDVQNILIDTISGDREKDTHEWQQSEQEARYYIEKLTSPDGLIVDFFIGGGTTAAAAKALGRKWIGFEVNASAAERASRRIEGAAA
jgi:hypothetical protein